jgi:hypothetical protein
MRGFNLEQIKFLEGRIRELDKENTRLRVQIKCLKQRIERDGFCPDCRDKTDGTCFRCKLQTANARINALVHF